MKILRGNLIIAALGMALAAHAQNILRDGDFELASGDPGATTAFSLGTSFDGGIWTVGPNPNSSQSTSAVIVDKTTDAISGTSVVLAANSIYQDLTTTVGQSYLVEFDAYGLLDPNTSLFQASFGDSSGGFIVPQNVVGRLSFFATAVSTTSRLTFAQARGNIVTLDNVTVTPQAIPEPASCAALGLGALALVRRRRA